jgi:hypothetical protein
MGRELKRVREKPCGWVTGMKWGIEGARISDGGWNRKESLRVNGCLERSELVPCGKDTWIAYGSLWPCGEPI